MNLGTETLSTVEDSLISSLHGTVLEIGAGGGANFDRLASDVDWIGLEPNRADTALLHANAVNHGQQRKPLVAECEAIPLEDGSVDAVLSTLVLCSVRDQRRSLEEIARVLRPGGVFVFAEHVAAGRRSILYRLQRIIAPVTRRFDHGCDPSRDTVSNIRRSPLKITELHEFWLPYAFGLSTPLVAGRAVAV
jgi:SAM-dependent methyltransferase